MPRPKPGAVIGRPRRAGTAGLLDYDSIAAELFLRGTFLTPPNIATISRIERAALQKLRLRLQSVTGQ